MRLNKFRKKQNLGQVKIILHHNAPLKQPQEPKQPEPPEKPFLDDEDCMELSMYMDAVAKVLRELCKDRNLNYIAAAGVVFESLAEEPGLWGVIDD